MSLKQLLTEIKRCTACKAHIEPRPVVQAGKRAKILIVGQAPGRAVHESGIAWDDASGDRLREWMGFGKEDFYDSAQVAIVPMGFCYPGTGDSGDLPPRKECFPLWHARLLREMPEVRLTLLVGQYAQRAYLQGKGERNLTETVRNWRGYLPRYLPLPHPSPLNNLWLAKNRWFERDLPAIRRAINSFA
jgi:uracil-DNA glycosylase